MVGLGSQAMIATSPQNRLDLDTRSCTTSDAQFPAMQARGVPALTGHVLFRLL